MTAKTRTGLFPLEMLLLWLLAPMWLAVFMAGTLVNSQPFRQSFAALEGGIVGMIWNGLLVAFTYTLTNVAILCVLAGVLGELGAKAVLGSDKQEEQTQEQDATSPISSAVLRSFLVYLAVIAGVLILGESPLQPTPNHYVRLAGAISLVGFVVSYRPSSFGRLLEHASSLFGDARPKPLPADGIVKLTELHESGALSDEDFRIAKKKLISA